MDNCFNCFDSMFNKNVSIRNIVNIDEMHSQFNINYFAEIITNYGNSRYTGTVRPPSNVQGIAAFGGKVWAVAINGDETAAVCFRYDEKTKLLEDIHELPSGHHYNSGCVAGRKNGNLYLAFGGLAHDIVMITIDLTSFNITKVSELVTEYTYFALANTPEGVIYALSNGYVCQLEFTSSFDAILSSNQLFSFVDFEDNIFNQTLLTQSYELITRQGLGYYKGEILIPYSYPNIIVRCLPSGTMTGIINMPNVCNGDTAGELEDIAYSEYFDSIIFNTCAQVATEFIGSEKALEYRYNTFWLMGEKVGVNFEQTYRGQDGITQSQQVALRRNIYCTADSKFKAEKPYYIGQKCYYNGTQQAPYVTCGRAFFKAHTLKNQYNCAVNVVFDGDFTNISEYARVPETCRIYLKTDTTRLNSLYIEDGANIVINYSTDDVTKATIKDVTLNTESELTSSVRLDSLTASTGCKITLVTVQGHNTRVDLRNCDICFYGDGTCTGTAKGVTAMTRSTNITDGVTFSAPLHSINTW